MKGLIIVSAVSTIWSLCLLLRDRGLGKENDKKLLEEAVSALTGGVIFGDPVTMEHNGKSYRMSMIFNPYLMYFMGCSGSIACTSGEVIMVSDVFRKMPEDVKRGAIAHEMGHYICGHQGSRMKQLNRLFGGNKSLEMELEADKTGAELVGTECMVKALSYMMTVPLISKKELKKRIHALKEV